MSFLLLNLKRFLSSNRVEVYNEDHSRVNEPWFGRVEEIRVNQKAPQEMVSIATATGAAIIKPHGLCFQPWVLLSWYYSKQQLIEELNDWKPERLDKLCVLYPLW